MKKLIYSILYILILFSTSCSKDWLDEKPSKSLVVPQTIKDFQALLDDPYTMNRGMPSAGLMTIDLLNITDTDLGTFEESERNIYSYTSGYIWAYEGILDWDRPFQAIESANIVLDGIKILDASNLDVVNLKGQAHFHRAYALYNLAQTFCPQYDSNTAELSLGLPIRLTSDVNVLEKRSPLSDLYNQIIKDLNVASSTLPEKGKNFFRASKVGALSMLAKVYLNMQDYPKARLYADSALMITSDLLDFNNTSLVSLSQPYVFPNKGINNPEIIFYTFGNLTWFEGSYPGSPIKVAESFFNSYSNNDLRKTFFFDVNNEGASCRSTYSGDLPMFQGISSNLLYFIRSECNARLGNITAAKEDIESVLKKRYKSGTAPTIIENDPNFLLRIILNEKTKEFPRVSNIWWEDLRRLNLEDGFKRTLRRTIKNVVHTLPPNDPRYVFPIPNAEIKLSGLEQNIR